MPETKNAEWEKFEGSDEDAATKADDYPAIDFNTFVLSLSTSALMHFEELQKQEGEPGEIQAKLAMARQTIDILGMIEQKTRGNLTGEEERLLQQILFDLRMRYVAKVRK